MRTLRREDFHANHNLCDAFRERNHDPLPVLAQQTAPNPQMQEQADKGAKTRQSGESGYAGEQEKPGASAHAPGTAAPTTGSTSGTSTGNSRQR